MKKAIIVIIIIVLVAPLLLSCSTTSSYVSNPQSAKVYDPQGNIIGTVEIPRGTGNLYWSDWAKFSFLLGLIGGSLFSLTTLSAR